MPLGKLMTEFEITYMVDPGDGIESKVVVEAISDDMAEVLTAWMHDHNTHFVTRCEIVGHSLQIK